MAELQLLFLDTFSHDVLDVSLDWYRGILIDTWECVVQWVSGPLSLSLSDTDWRWVIHSDCESDWLWLWVWLTTEVSDWLTHVTDWVTHASRLSLVLLLLLLLPLPPQPPLLLLLLLLLLLPPLLLVLLITSNFCWPRLVTSEVSSHRDRLKSMTNHSLTDSLLIEWLEGHSQSNSNTQSVRQPYSSTVQCESSD